MLDELRPDHGPDLADLVVRLLVDVAALRLVAKRQEAKLMALEQRLAALGSPTP